MSVKSPSAANSPVRRFKRYPQVRELSIIYEGYSEEITIRPPDISLQGMFINTPRRFPEGAVLGLQFTLEPSGHRISARAEVRYCLPGVGIGVEFVDICAEARRMIEAELSHWESQLPGDAPR